MRKLGAVKKRPDHPDVLQYSDGVGSQFFLLYRSICSFVCEWEAVGVNNFVSNATHAVLKNFVFNLGPVIHQQKFLYVIENDAKVNRNSGNVCSYRLFYRFRPCQL